MVSALQSSFFSPLPLQGASDKIKMGKGKTQGKGLDRREGGLDTISTCQEFLLKALNKG